MADHVYQPAVSDSSDPLFPKQPNFQSSSIAEPDDVDSRRYQPATRLGEFVKKEEHTHGPNANEEQKATSAGPHVLPSVFDRWIAELLACVVALIALAAIVITLETHKGRPIPDWPFGISINALVSIFSVILRGTMMIPVAECKRPYLACCYRQMGSANRQSCTAVSQLKWLWYQTPRPLGDLVRFDDASRGIWGSARLIERLRGMHLASLGAAITILAIASDPFIQQVIETYPCAQHLGDGTASMPRTNSYNQSGIHTGADQSSLDLPMQAAIYEGVYNSFFPIQPVCTTGNCTFGNFRTAGMCTECQDISDRVKTNCSKDCNCVWKLPSGLNLTQPTDAIAMTMGPSDPTDILESFPSITDIMSFRDIENAPEPQGDTCIKLKTPMAIQCSLFPCVRTYSSNVTGGLMSQVLLSTQELRKSEGLGPYAGYELYSAIPMPCLMNGTYHEATSFTERNSTNSIPVSGLLKDNQTAYIPNECYFAFSNPLGLMQYLPGFLNGFAADAPEVQYADPAWVGQLYNSGNATLETISASWAALSDSMTVRIRRSPDGFDLPPFRGDAWHTQICISVKWPWLAYPAALLALTIVFLLATIVQSACHSRNQIWKSSPLALLFHGLDNDLREKFHVVDRTEEMEQTAKGLSVKLGRETGEVRFVESFGAKG